MKKEPILRKCKKHGLVKHIYENAGTHLRCTKCRVEAVQKHRIKTKLKAIEYKGGKCVKCGYNKCQDALDFHHINPDEKDFALAGGGIIRSWEKVKIELDKCILLCANCHREIHTTVR